MAVAQVYDPVAGATVDQQALYEYMSYLSEDCYCAGWMEGTEAACWEAVVNGGTRFGIGFITAEEAAELRRLSETAGGWWHWRGGRRRGRARQLGRKRRRGERATRMAK